MGMVCEFRMGQPGNKSIADTFLGTRWTAALPLCCILAARGMYRSLPMEGRGSDLGLTHRGQSSDCLESEEKGDVARMQKAAHNSAFL